MHLSRFSRCHFAHLNTPLEPLERLSKALGGPKIWVKRDDCTGLAGGGNKTRKLEFLMGQALALNADVIITQGAVQSNHARQTAAIATKLGKECHILLEDRISSEEADYSYNGNVFLDQLYDAKLSRFAAGTDMQAQMELLADKLRGEGKNPYIIPGGGSNPVGALGYVNCALELLTQANNQSLIIDTLVHATGSAGTQAGLVTGFCALNSRIPVLGISVRADETKQKENVYALACKTAQYLDATGVVKPGDIKVNSQYVGAGYGIPAPSTLEAIQLFAKTESLLLDPVYSGKGAAGLIDLIRKGHFNREDNVVFLHTGGAQALFAYRKDFNFPRYY